MKKSSAVIKLSRILDDESWAELKGFLLRREDDIFHGTEDFADLRNIFLQIFDRPAEEKP